MITGSKQRVEKMEVKERIAELLEYPFWSTHYETLRGDPEALASGVPRFRAALQAAGYSYSVEEVLAALLFCAGYDAGEEGESTELEVAKEPLEGEIVDDGGWDEDRAHEVSCSALRYISEHTRDVDLDAIDRTEADRVEDEMHAAAEEEGDLEAYIVATRRWASAWRRAAQQLRVGE